MKRARSSNGVDPGLSDLNTSPSEPKDWRGRPLAESAAIASARGLERSTEIAKRPLPGFGAAGLDPGRSQHRHHLVGCALVEIGVELRLATGEQQAGQRSRRNVADELGPHPPHPTPSFSFRRAPPPPIAA